MKTARELEVIEDKLTAACDSAIARGWVIDRVLFSRAPKCCVIGAISPDTASSDDIFDIAMSELGLKDREVWGIINGFDGNEHKYGEFPELSNLGKRFYEKYVEKT